MDTICPVCGKDYVYVRGKGGTMKYCGSCMVNKRRFKQKQEAVKYLGGKCQKCGYDKSVTAMQFHHRNPDEKSFTISGNHSRAWTKTLAELDKCDLLCANCHHEVEYGVVPVGTVYPV
jgi:5-methylcytosine-specific restriction endonuclease McrA